MIINPKAIDSHIVIVNVERYNAVMLKTDTRYNTKPDTIQHTQKFAWAGAKPPHLVDEFHINMPTSMPACA